MLVGYVSDERFVAVEGVALEFERDETALAVVRSTPRGAVYADVEPGRYRVTLVKDGFGSKHVDMEVREGAPHQFRLLSDCLLGFMWPKWVRSGEQAQFRVHSVEPFRLTLWRYGREKEFQRMLGWFDEHGPRAVMQITPDGDYTQTGVHWNSVGYGNNPHHTELVAAPERSGLYYLHAETESGDFFSFPWVVAPRQPSARTAVLAPTNTWNAYNNFGGRSNYINPNQLPPRPTVNARQDLLRYSDQAFNTWGFDDHEYSPLSFERPEPGNLVPRDVMPTDPIRGRLACGLAPTEWRLLAWLEREGFGYDLYSDAQLHDGRLDLDAYAVLILSVHPEYWTRTMYDRVKAWVYERGGRLMYLAGNGLNCEVELSDDGASLRTRSMLRPPHAELGMYDPDDPSVYFDSRFHRTYESEANLLGVVTTHTGIMTAAPYRVVDADHWLYAGTGLRAGDLFGVHGLQERGHGGASGHETDKMSPHSPPGTRLLAKGLNPDDGGAEMVHYEVPRGGGQVFSVGSITWVASVLVDAGTSRITSNVLSRFLA
jgi:N,N-dimethylformamidase